MPGHYSLVRDAIMKKLASLLARVDAAPVTRKQKLKLFHLDVCSRLSWDLTITEFPASWLEKTLNPMVTHHLKTCAGFARPPDPTRLLLPQARGGFNLFLPSDLYHKLQVGKASLMMTSKDAGDDVVRESLRKEESQQCRKFHPHIIA